MNRRNRCARCGKMAVSQPGDEDILIQNADNPTAGPISLAEFMRLNRELDPDYLEDMAQDIREMRPGEVEPFDHQRWERVASSRSVLQQVVESSADYIERQLGETYRNAAQGLSDALETFRDDLSYGEVYGQNGNIVASGSPHDVSSELLGDPEATPADAERKFKSKLRRELEGRGYNVGKTAAVSQRTFDRQQWDV